VDSEIRSHSGYSANDWRLPAQPFEEGDQPNTGPTLIVTLLLSLALWAGIWGLSALWLRLCCNSLLLPRSRPVALAGLGVAIRRDPVVPVRLHHIAAPIGTIVGRKGRGRRLPLPCRHLGTTGER